MNAREQREFELQHPHPGNDPVKRLRHTLDVYDNDVTDNDWAIRATGGVYGQGEVTGLTWGDLRAIAAQIGA